MAQLRDARATAEQSRKDLRTDRRIDFLQSVIMDVALQFEQLVQQSNLAHVPVIAARLRVLPVHMMPLLRRVCGLPVPPLVHDRVERLLREAADRGVIVGGGPTGMAAVLQPEIREEIRESLDELTEERP